MDHTTIQVQAFREKIGPIEVVDADFADKMLRTMVRIMNAHAEWREALAVLAEEDSKTNRNRRNRKRASYRKARAAGWVIANEAVGNIPEPM
jgi:hypothetical protein